MSTEEQPAPARLQRLAMLGGLAAALAAMAGIYWATHGGGGPGEAAAPFDQAQAVTVVPVEEASFSRRVAIAGQARPVRDIAVRAPASGVRVMAFLVDEGANVREGQPLARLDAALATAQLDSARAALRQAEVEALRAHSEAARAEAIKDSGALSAEAIAQRRTLADAADARLAAAKAQLAELDARLQGGYVRAPASGLVIDRSGVLGEPVDGQTLFRIAAGGSLELAAEVSEGDILALKAGQPARLTLVDGTAIEARLSRPPASIDPRTRTGEALFSLKSHPKLRAGMFLAGEVRMAPVDALSAPQSAIVFDEAGTYAFVVDAQSVARRRAVQVAMRDGERVAIAAGLEPGDRIVSNGAAFLRDGDLVRAVEDGTGSPATPPAAPAAAAASSARVGG